MGSPIAEAPVAAAGRYHGGPLDSATHAGQAGEPGCGPWMRLAFCVEDGVVVAARWETYGCPVSMACGEAVCAVSEGRDLARVRTLAAADVARLVGAIPEGKDHCPQLAADAIRALAPLDPSIHAAGETEPARRSGASGSPASASAAADLSKEGCNVDSG